MPLIRHTDLLNTENILRFQTVVIKSDRPIIVIIIVGLTGSLNGVDVQRVVDERFYERLSLVLNRKTSDVIFRFTPSPRNLSSIFLAVLFGFLRLFTPFIILIIAAFPIVYYPFCKIVQKGLTFCITFSYFNIISSYAMSQLNSVCRIFA